jgi:hypothetical protein
MNTAALKVSPLPSPGLGDVLDQLTVTYADMVDRYGPLLGFAAPPPAEAVPFAAEQARKGLMIDTAASPAEKANALLDKEAHRHQQIGRLAFWLAGYELAHGDKDNVPPMQQLGKAHFELADGLRGQISQDRLNVPAEKKADPNALQFAGSYERTDDLLPPGIKAELEASTSNQNERGTGRSR